MYPYQQTIAEHAQSLINQRRIPRATYRLQFGGQTTFQAALALVDYLHTLGISDYYASPILQPRQGSTHGYDVSDHNQLNEALGSRADFDALTDELRNRRMGFILDIVPNHMGVGDPLNTWWMDVLENGPSSLYADYFDIQWQPVKPELANKVLLPMLGDQYGRELENGHFKLCYGEGSFWLEIYGQRMPVAPRTYSPVLSYALEQIQDTLPTEHEHLIELQSILTALSYLPASTDTEVERMAERHREKEVIKRRIATLYEASPHFQAALNTTLTVFNGQPGDTASYDRLDALINAQRYRPAYWRVAADEINYRRFFDVNDMAALRVEVPEVFEASHRFIYELLASERASGLRVDHPDGLWNPPQYFRQLQEQYLAECLRLQLPEMDSDVAVLERVSEWLDESVAVIGADEFPWPLYVVAEKILSEEEPLPADWAVAGTTGYDFLNTVNGIFVDKANEEALTDIYLRFRGLVLPFSDLIYETKKTIMRDALASEINALSFQLERLSEKNRNYRDFTLTGIRFALVEVIACLQIYRTYTTESGIVSERDVYYIRAAIEEAKRRNPRSATPVFDFLRDILLLNNLGEFAEAFRPEVIAFVMKFQQISGPVMAKGVEDTAFYIYYRLTSLNEVGGHPEQFGVSVEQFHAANQLRARRWPHAMLSSSTHDTKRSEDTRARINIISEMPLLWGQLVNAWRQMNAPAKINMDTGSAPDANDEYLLYQTLVGIWPLEDEPDLEVLQERLGAYLAKASKEAKVHTSWINPLEYYDRALQGFLKHLLTKQPFLDLLRPFQRLVSYYGMFNSLSQTLLKLTAPGVPDVYQGTELWDYSLVDPDNRRPVDYELRRSLLESIQAMMSESEDRTHLTETLLGNMVDGRIKLYVIYTALNFRRDHPNLFTYGDYIPMGLRGEKADCACVFARTHDGEQVLTVVPRLIVRLMGETARERLEPPLGEIWGDTLLLLAPGRYRHVFTEEIFTTEGDTLRMADVCRQFPVAMLQKLD